jgi:hypothetical protein
MHDWKITKIRKQSKGSHTPGSQKTKQCQTTPLKKFLAKRSRSYKHPQYENWDTIFGKR